MRISAISFLRCCTTFHRDVLSDATRGCSFCVKQGHASLAMFSRLADADNQYKHAEASKLTMRRDECGILQALRFIPMWKE